MTPLATPLGAAAEDAAFDAAMAELSPLPADSAADAGAGGAGADPGATAASPGDAGDVPAELAGADAAAALGDSVGKPKRARRHPPLNDALLQGKSGVLDIYKRAPSVLQKLRSHKRKGCELQDLEAIIGFYQGWHKRCYPHVPYNAFVERVATLGSKRKMHNFLQTIRFDEHMQKHGAQTEDDGALGALGAGDATPGSATGVVGADQQQQAAGAEANAFNEVFQTTPGAAMATPAGAAAAAGAGADDDEENFDDLMADQTQRAPLGADQADDDVAAEFWDGGDDDEDLF